MRLALKNIRFVKCLEQDGIIYEYYVAMKSGKISDGRLYFDDKRMLVTYPVERLPVTVQKYIATHKRSVFEIINGANTTVTVHIYH